MPVLKSTAFGPKMANHGSSGARLNFVVHEKQPPAMETLTLVLIAVVLDILDPKSPLRTIPNGAYNVN